MRDALPFPDQLGAGGRPILNNSDPGQAVYEPFLGSGTTLIAAQSTGRVCYGIEIDPIFVDVVIRRWQSSPAKLLFVRGTGRPSPRPRT
jgi:DNA modification methylase